MRSGLGSRILGGWLVNPVISALSGVPFTVAARGNLSANGASQTADLVGPFYHFAPSTFAAPLNPNASCSASATTPGPIGGSGQLCKYGYK